MARNRAQVLRPGVLHQVLGESHGEDWSKNIDNLILLGFDLVLEGFI